MRNFCWRKTFSYYWAKFVRRRGGRRRSWWRRLRRKWWERLLVVVIVHVLYITCRHCSPLLSLMMGSFMVISPSQEHSNPGRTRHPTHPATHPPAKPKLALSKRKLLFQSFPSLKLCEEHAHHPLPPPHLPVHIHGRRMNLQVLKLGDQVGSSNIRRAGSWGSS